MTEKQRDIADELPLHALWQWLGVALSHAAMGIKAPYIEPMLRDAEILIHRDNIVTVRFQDGSIVQVRLNYVDVIREGGIKLPIFN